MNTRLGAGCLALGLILAATSAPALNLKVDIVSDTQSTTRGGTSRGRNAPTPQRTTTQTKSLEVTLTNPTQQNYANLTVAYYLFAKDVQTKEIVLVRKGEKAATVKPLGKATIRTDEAVMTSQIAYSRTVGGKVETTPASGQKFYGYGVQVLAGQKLLAQTFDPPELKASTNLPETPPAAGRSRARTRGNQN
jgi:hypothetical protein